MDRRNPLPGEGYGWSPSQTPQEKGQGWTTNLAQTNQVRSGTSTSSGTPLLTLGSSTSSLHQERISAFSPLPPQAGWIQAAPPTPPKPNKFTLSLIQKDKLKQLREAFLQKEVQFHTIPVRPSQMTPPPPYQYTSRPEKEEQEAYISSSVTTMATRGQVMNSSFPDGPPMTILPDLASPGEPWLSRNRRRGLAEAINIATLKTSGDNTNWGQAIGRSSGNVGNPNNEEARASICKNSIGKHKTPKRRALTITKLSGSKANPNRIGPSRIIPRDATTLPQGTLSLADQSVLEADLFTLLDPIQESRRLTHPDETTTTFVVTMGGWIPAPVHEEGPVTARNSLIEVLPDGTMPPNLNNRTGNQSWISTVARTKATTTWGQVSKGGAEGGGCTVGQPTTNS